MPRSCILDLTETIEERKIPDAVDDHSFCFPCTADFLHPWLDRIYSVVFLATPSYCILDMTDSTKEIPEVEFCIFDLTEFRLNRFRKAVQLSKRFSMWTLTFHSHCKLKRHTFADQLV